MIQLFQESIPFSNKRIDAPTSKDGSFLNPVIMPFAINTTLGSNTFETVIYIRNTSIENFYNDIVVSLMKEDSNISETNITSGVLKTDHSTGIVKFSVNDYTDIVISPGFPYIGTQSAIKVLDGKYQQNYMPVLPSTDAAVSVKFSYGYDELSNLDWDSTSPIIVIPMIGNQTTPDTSYIPIRMRLTFNETPSVFTIRDYFIDISYALEGDVI
jgi:hypothetical protein